MTVNILSVNLYKLGNGCLKILLWLNFRNFIDAYWYQWNRKVKLDDIYVTVNLMYNGVVIAPKGIELIHGEKALPNLVKISHEWKLVFIITRLSSFLGISSWMCWVTEIGKERMYSAPSSSSASPSDTVRGEWRQTWPTKRKTWGDFNFLGVQNVMLMDKHVHVVILICKSWWFFT